MPSTNALIQYNAVSETAANSDHQHVCQRYKGQSKAGPCEKHDKNAHKRKIEEARKACQRQTSCAKDVWQYFASSSRRPPPPRNATYQICHVTCRRTHKVFALKTQTGRSAPCEMIATVPFSIAFYFRCRFRRKSCEEMEIKLKNLLFLSPNKCVIVGLFTYVFDGFICSLISAERFEWRTSGLRLWKKTFFFLISSENRLKMIAKKRINFRFHRLCLRRWCDFYVQSNNLGPECSQRFQVSFWFRHSPADNEYGLILPFLGRFHLRGVSGRRNDGCRGIYSNSHLLLPTVQLSTGIRKAVARRVRLTRKCLEFVVPSHIPIAHEERALELI